ncbi:Aim20p KNAG_0L02230 [Huiozyma naganishii CBS 8797]|uniref:Uncharacterized protein n=1 Tax=Huiozyma naganishii (strain ATCC MYA-139 / BCRC 22969 / CBS 8797 / KCTC 17520 / NBRC 10181 / NCYC 3082 / Yp74L-3) TaxID=1071383 RepID=J7RD76_HUIN7|nr:hypothetical protein KNAG_0L02230 [Kazachstania naganishii CBS 8797]CCK72840.1 hypothetical protein KNAG_0L02230 [Kazachstania naganishii CBS 8797]
MVGLSVAVGLSLGVPIGCGVALTGAFWVVMQRRLQREDVRDLLLQQEIDGDGDAQFDTLLDAVWLGPMSHTAPSAYTPAYRRQITDETSASKNGASSKYQTPPSQIASESIRSDSCPYDLMVPLLEGERAPRDGQLLRNLYRQDFGSYYPRRDSREVVLPR